MYNVIGMPITRIQETGDRRQRSGFTLIEILIVLTIVALMSGLGAANFANSQKRGRDSVRLSDLNQYRVAIENFTTVNGGVGPTPSPGVAGTVLATDLSKYMSKMLADPKNSGNNVYYFWQSNGIDWVLRTTLEAQNQVWEICSNGKIGTTTKAVTANEACTP